MNLEVDVECINQRAAALTSRESAERRVQRNTASRGRLRMILRSAVTSEVRLRRKRASFKRRSYP